MLKKLTEEKLGEVLKAGISEFAEHGFYHASMSVIAERAGTSVGVLYKYYADKERFFMACLEKSMGELDRLLAPAAEPEDKLIVYAERVIRSLQENARTQRDGIRMYNRLVAGGGPCQVGTIKQIERLTARLYTGFIETAKRDVTIRRDIDAKLFAFFFDNLLMMMQFSYACDYYRERFRIYCGEETLERDEYVRKEMLKFLEPAFTFVQDEAVHREPVPE